MTENKESSPLEPSPEKSDGAAESERIERRAFFSAGFRDLFKPFSEIVERRLDHFHRAFEESQAAVTPSAGSSSGGTPGYFGDSEPRLLRPPGALQEELFLDRCACSGQCLSVCPVQAIQVLESDDSRLSGTPFIDPEIQACVVCEDLACMKACPSGALQTIPRHLIHIGVAEVNESICLRSEGQDCEICVEKCPLGSEAIHIPFEGAAVEVKTDGCIGCGVCEMYCPTEPRAIVIKPA